jgi:hypothetical protein
MYRPHPHLTRAPRALRITAIALLAALPLPMIAATPTASPSGTGTAAKPTASRAATSREQLRNQAKGLALATETVEQITEAQLELASRVLTGDADCEFDQKIGVQPVAGQPGHFQVAYKKAVYRMVPQETTTGAVRLEDRKAGIMWLQIPTKSMLMNIRIGQRMVDACTHSEQRAAVAAAEAAARSPAHAAASSAAADAMATPAAEPAAAPPAPATPVAPPVPGTAASSTAQ